MPLRNGLVAPQAPPSPFQCSLLSLHNLCRLIQYLLLLFRFASFSFSLSSAVFMASDLKPSITVWTHFDAFRSCSGKPIKTTPFFSVFFNHKSGVLIRAGICRFVVAASGIVAVYSFFEMGVSAWEILRGTTPLPEIFQLWFDFGHDQGFAYLLLSATAAATVEVRKQWAAETCKRENGFCVQATISAAMAFVAFLFLACSAVLSGFRLACYSITGSRFYP